MGANTIDTMVSRMKKNSPLSGSSRKFTNHSSRKTCVRILRESKFQKCEIKNVTGHASAEGLDAYDSGDDDDLRNMSLALQPSSSVASSSKSRPVNPVHPPSSPTTKQHNRYPPNYPFPNSTPNFSFGLNLDDDCDNMRLAGNNFSSSRPTSAPTRNQSHFNPYNFAFGVNENIQPVVYNNCTFNYGATQQPPPAPASKRRRLIIESDSDNSQN